ncbi:MAG TPA: helix-turn-helix domain-containing protein [Candidatus Bathyarchaeia archaeon]|nr:helix-turn-helix domain-containing protein [Candidatus Bathyarchaeia archaeon]
MYTVRAALKRVGEDKPLLPTVAFKNCPIRISLGVLGKKWTLLILRDIAFLKIDRFNQIKRSLPGLTPRVLTLRLKELQETGIIERVIIQRRPKVVRWKLTKMGKDTIPILMSFISFGATWYPKTVFEDGRPRTAEELFPNPSAISPKIGYPS